MDFQPNEEQRLLVDSVQRFVREQYAFTARRRLLDTPEGFDPGHWRTFADNGWLAVGVPESAGGLGGSMAEIALVLETFGSALVLEPYLSTVVLGARLLAGGSGATRDEVLARIATGDARVALAAHEPAGRFDPAFVSTHAGFGTAGWTIDGAKCLVHDGAAAHWLVVSARVRGATDDPDGIGLFLIPSDAPGVALRPYRTLDGRRAADITLDGVRVPPEQVLAEPGAAWPLLEDGLDHACVGLCAEAVGAMDRALALAADYIKTRRQFGQPLAAFQVLQHRCADMFVALDQARSMLYQAIGALDADARARRWAVSAAKVSIGQAGGFVGGEAVHLHGGNGMTDEYEVGHYLRRLMLIEKTYGDIEHHVSRCMAHAP
ncbi:MAG: acyl-CoA dehydrogenase family protein [Gammaproteobacteria bacterium]